MNEKLAYTSRVKGLFRKYGNFEYFDECDRNGYHRVYLDEYNNFHKMLDRFRLKNGQVGYRLT